MKWGLIEISWINEMKIDVCEPTYAIALDID